MRRQAPPISTAKAPGVIGLDRIRQL